jgi:hypothetical protein
MSATSRRTLFFQEENRNKTPTTHNASSASTMKRTLLSILVVLAASYLMATADPDPNALLACVNTCAARYKGAVKVCHRTPVSDDHDPEKCVQTAFTKEVTGTAKVAEDLYIVRNKPDTV